MKRCYYDVLGVTRGSRDSEIKAAFRRLAKECHPDRCNGDPNAEKRFKEVNEAYETLKDPQRRAAYDRACAWWWWGWISVGCVFFVGCGAVSPCTRRIAVGLRRDAARRITFGLRVRCDAAFAWARAVSASADGEDAVESDWECEAVGWGCWWE